MSQTTDAPSWDRFCRWYTEFPEIGLAMDLSRMNFSNDFVGQIEPRLAKAFTAMEALEAAQVQMMHGPPSPSLPMSLQIW